ncbi:MAG TPA: MFS transporter [Magnetospirillaceae bacterium]|jgi:EmrB/QacA subfamily drug resistance transporter
MGASAPRSLLIPLIVACALFMENLDSTVLATALPAIARSLGEVPLRLNLGITSYLFSLAVFIPISGWMADRFGARSVFCTAIVIFTTGSILCGFSDSLWQFVAARIFQGLGGAMMVPVGRLVLLRTTPKSELVSAMAYVTIPALVGPVIGPPLGGFITTYFSWRWIFWINVPIGIIGVSLALSFIGNIRESTVGALDFRGFLLTAIGFTGLIFGFEFIGRGVIPIPVALGLMVVGAIGLAIYVRHARQTVAPLLDLSLLRLDTFRAGVVGGFMFRVGVGAIPFLMPLMLQVGFGYNPLHSGLLTFAAAAGALLMKTSAAPILRRFGFRRVLIFNAAISAAFLASYALFRATTPAFVIFGLLLLGGFFRSLEFTSLNTISYADVGRDRMSAATSFASMVQQLSMSVGVGVAAIILHFTVLTRHGDTLVADDFINAFLIVAAMSSCSIFMFNRLPRDAGAELISTKYGRGQAQQPSSQAS